MKDTCALCGNEWQPEQQEEGYEWLCPECRNPNKPCICGSDDVRLDWEIPIDLTNGGYLPPSWRVECLSCERRTAYYETAKEANTAWINGECLTPIRGTGHFEEVW